MTEEEISVFEEYRKKVAELKKTNEVCYKELREAIKGIVEQEQLHPKEMCVFSQSFELGDIESDYAAKSGYEPHFDWKLTNERLHQIETKALRRFRHPRLASSVLDYLESDTLYVLVEDTVSEEQKAQLKTVCEEFSKRLTLQYVHFYFLNAPSELDFSYPDESNLPKNLSDDDVLLISKTEPCLSWFERSCIIPPRSDGKMVPRYISVQPKILQSNALEKMTGNTVFAYPSLSKVAWFKGTIILADEHFVPEKEDFDLLTKHFETKKRK